MFGDHFYHATLRKTVSVFGTLFNNLSTVRRNKDNTIADQQKVPLAYGPKQKFLERIEAQPDLTDPKVALKLPRMSFEILGMQYDSTTKLSALNRLTTSSTSTSRTSIATSVPYIIDMELNIMAKNQDDALQILEQILPFFQPQYNVSVKLVDDVSETFDMPITLQAVTMTDDYQGDYTTRRVIVYTLTFAIKTRFFSGVNTSSIIKQIDANMYKQDPQGFLNDVNVQADSNGDPVVTYRSIPSDAIITIKSESEANQVTYTAGDTVYGDVTGTIAEVVEASIDADPNGGWIHTIKVRYPDGYFISNEELVNSSSNEFVTIVEYTVS